MVSLRAAPGGDSLTASLVSFTIYVLCFATITMLRGGIAPSLMEVPVQPL
jgi:transporter family-2 protein